MVFASLSGQFYLDVTNSYHLPGLSHLNNFIVTRKFCPLIGTVQKRMPTLTQTATPHTTGPLTIIRRVQYIRLPALQVIIFTLTRYFFSVYQFVPLHTTYAFKNLFRVTNTATLTIFCACLIILPTRI